MLQVVVAVIRDKDDQILITQRAKGKHQGEKWEFPGGKIEQSEFALQALRRELDEELGIQITTATPFMQLEHHYAELSVFLDIYEVRKWQGKAYGKEGQAIYWVNKETIKNYTFPDANKAILKALEGEWLKGK